MRFIWREIASGKEYPFNSMMELTVFLQAHYRTISNPVASDVPVGAIIFDSSVPLAEQRRMIQEFQAIMQSYRTVRREAI